MTVLTLFPSSSVGIMNSTHQKKTDSTDKIAVFFSDESPGGKGLGITYFEEYGFSMTFQDVFLADLSQDSFVIIPNSFDTLDAASLWMPTP